jgi:hypothetical protein
VKEALYVRNTLAVNPGMSSFKYLPRAYSVCPDPDIQQ